VDRLLSRQDDLPGLASPVVVLALASPVLALATPPRHPLDHPLPRGERVPFRQPCEAAQIKAWRVAFSRVADSQGELDNFQGMV